MTTLSGRFEKYFKLGELVLDTLHQVDRLANPSHEPHDIWNAVSHALDTYARPEFEEPMRELVRKFNPEATQEDLDNIRIGIKAAGSLIKIAHATAMMMAGNPVPMLKLQIKHALQLMRDNPHILDRILLRMREDGIDPDKPPRTPMRMLLPKPRTNTDAIAQGVMQQQRAASTQRSRFIPRMS